MSEYIVDTFGIVQDFADLHGDMNTPLYEAIMGVMVSRQREEIVRCRDCRFWHQDASHCAQFEFSKKLCYVPAKPDGFCAWGERRNDDR